MAAVAAAVLVELVLIALRLEHQILAAVAAVAACTT
jgi:hypothetical protein